MRRAEPVILFSYTLAVTLLAMLSHSLKPLLAITLLNLLPGTAFGWRRGKIFLILFVLGLFGVFLNSIFFSNTGKVLFEVGGLPVRKGAIEAFSIISLRLAAILGAALLFFGLVDVRELLEAMEDNMRLPRGFVFSLAVGIRMIWLIQKDSGEIQQMRVQRGYSRIPIAPKAMASFLRPLLSVSLERAKWIGIAAELRGISLRRRASRRIRFGIPEALLTTSLALQLILTLNLI